MAMNPRGAAGLHVLRSGKSKLGNHANILRELRENPDLAGFVAFDEFAQVVMLRRPIPDVSNLACPTSSFQPRPWRDDDATLLCAFLNAQGFRKAPASIVRDLITVEARVHGFHPVRNFLTGLVWDGEHRIGRLFLDHCGAKIGTADPVEAAKATAYVEAVARCFFIGAVARVMRPGCKLDNMVVLEGSQGALKSKLLRTLAVCDDWFTDSVPHNLDNKDARAHLAGKWIAELSELSQFRGSSVETLKSFLSCQIDKFRPAYGRNDISIPRQCIFAGSTNARTYLHDPSGARRFWPITLTTIALDKIEPLVPQLWAEAYAAWKDREQWWLTPEMEKIAADQQADRQERDPWHQTIARFVERQDTDAFFTALDVFNALDMTSPGDRKRGDEMRISGVLTDLGCVHERRQVSGNRRWGWVKYDCA
jgi:predicted P-loop ATPase